MFLCALLELIQLLTYTVLALFVVFLFSFSLLNCNYSIFFTKVLKSQIRRRKQLFQICLRVHLPPSYQCLVLSQIQQILSTFSFLFPLAFKLQNMHFRFLFR